MPSKSVLLFAARLAILIALCSVRLVAQMPIPYGEPISLEAAKKPADAALAEAARNRHRGESRLSSPATTPYMRVRIRRFGGLS